MDNKERCMIKAKDLQVKGYTQREISEKLGVCERTVRNYIHNPSSSRKKVTRKSKLDPYYEYIKSVINEKPYYNCELIYVDLQKMKLSRC